MQEIERKFLLQSIPGGVRGWVSIRQGYLSWGQGAAVRIREFGDRYWLTCKHGQGLIRDEWEIEITREQWRTLWPATVTARIDKRRGRLADGPFNVTVDAFHGPLEGLVIAEIEFATLDAARTFVPRPWMLQDVTDDPRYTNRSLSTNGLPGPTSRPLPWRPPASISTAREFSERSPAEPADFHEGSTSV